MNAGEAHSRLIHVVAAAVVDMEGRILIAQRSVGKPLAGGWEFPGGKLEPGETRIQALTRELNEELGITLTAHPRPLMRLRHTYPYGEVLLDMWVVTEYTGELTGRDGQAIRWCTQEELESATDLLPADRPVVRALRLPERLTTVANEHYALGAIGDRFDAAKLRGLLSSSSVEAVAAALTGAFDFIVMHQSSESPELALTCAAIDVPVFARGIDPDAARVMGLSGTAEF